jgi:hypothetical protein
VTDEELLESLDRHFLAGCKGLTPRQLQQHKATGTCHECQRLARLARCAAKYLATANPT